MISTEPSQSCKLCGNHVTVTPFTRGFPPDAAKRKLKAMCAARGCECDPVYQAGMTFRVMARGQEGDVRVAAPPAPAEPEHDQLGGDEG